MLTARSLAPVESAESEVPASSRIRVLTPCLPSVAEASNPRGRANAAMERYAAGGDESAFSELYDLLAPRVYAYLMRQTRDQLLAEDLLQETMFRLHAHRSRFIRGSNVTPWAFGIARRLLIDSLRARRRAEKHRDRTWYEGSGIVNGTEDTIHYRRAVHVLEHELARLPEAQRVTFELLQRDGLSLKEVAEVLGTTVSAIKVRAHRAYVNLRAALGKQVAWDGA
jgi:RNA polymerase sigma-70 factor (ECF subfamily)